MRTSDQNKLLLKIQEASLPKEQFRRTVGMGTDRLPCVNITWVPGSYQFHISEQPSGGREIFSVLWSTPASVRNLVEPYRRGLNPRDLSIDHLMILFGDWLEHIKHANADSETVDLWGFNRPNLERNDFQGATSGEQFTEPEKDSLRQALVRFESKLAEVAVTTQTQSVAVHEKLQYLSERLDIHSRFDWAALARDILMGILVNSFVDRETAAQVLNYCSAYLTESSKKFLKWFDS